MFIIITDNDVKNTIGGLERAAIRFGQWLETEEDVTFYSAIKIIKSPQKLKKRAKIIFVGHRSISILVVALWCSLIRRSYDWCPFWHDFNLEGKKGIRYPIYDWFFMQLLSYSKNHYVVSRYEMLKTKTKAKQSLIRLPSFIETQIKRKMSMTNFDRPIDILFVGRDVPHKQRYYAKKVANELNLTLTEVVPGEHSFSDEDLIEAYSQSKIVFIPSKYESYSLVALEALMMGAFVIGFPHVLIGEHFEKYSRYAKAPISHQEIISLIQRTISNWSSASNDEISYIYNNFSDAKCKEIFIESSLS
jgi:glycosyltransferase involved in cell wall biosynthesis